jgi:hypothetical protein
MRGTRLVHWRHCTIIAVGLAVAVATASIWWVHVDSAGAIGEARRQSQADATAFARAAEVWTTEQAAEAWISLDARQSFERTVDLMLLGESAYVQVVLGGAVILNSSDESWGSTLPLPGEHEAEELGGAVIQSEGGRLVADIVVPIGPWNPKDPGGPPSYARVGYELNALAGQLRAIRLAGAGIGGAVYLLACAGSLLGLAWLDHRGLLRSPLTRFVQPLSELRPPPQEALHLDEGSKQIVLHGVPIFLPPKLFQMLCLLVSEEGRVLQESEIVSALWPETCLADSRDIRQCVYLLRKRLDSAVAGAGACIANVKGFGYRYDAAALVGLLSDCEPSLVASP